MMNSLVALLFSAAAIQPPTTILRVDVEGLRDIRGVLRGCLTANRQAFPDCSRDPHALKVTVPAAARQLVFTGFAPRDYAVTLFHDANANGKLDTVLGVPREGFGFSRNPVIRFGPPPFDKVNIRLGSGFSRIAVRAQYIL